MTTDVEVDDFLAHYGIPGMRWGRRSASPMSSKSKRRVGAAAATVAGGAVGALAGQQGLKYAVKALQSKKLNDKLVTEALKNQPALIRKMARKQVSKTMAAKSNELVSQLTNSRNKTAVIAGTAIVGAILVGGATLATVHAVQNRRREKREEQTAKESKEE